MAIISDPDFYDWRRTVIVLGRVFAKIGLIQRSISLRMRCITGGSWISLGSRIHVFPGAKLYIGRGVRVGSGCVISVLSGASLRISNNSIINNGCYIYVAERVEIGSHVRVAHYCSIIDHDYDFSQGGDHYAYPKISAPITVSDFVWVGACAVLLKGVSIGERSVVGAHCVVTKKVPAYNIAYNKTAGALTLRKIQRC